jgi:proline iminopeptidase
MKPYKISFAIVSAFILFAFLNCQTNPILTPGEGYIEVRGGKIWYRIIGEGNKTPIVLLHGGPGGTSWALYPLAELGKDRPFILYDQLGSGRSDHNIDTTLMNVENFVEQLKAIKSALCLKNLYIYGHSWGTALGLEYYLAYPKGIKALIFNSPLFSTPTWIKDADSLVSYLPDSIQILIDKAKENKTYTTSEFEFAVKIYNQNYNLRGPVIYNKYDTMPAPPSWEIYEYMWGPYEFVSTGTLKNYDITYRLKEVKIPTLFITGRFDEARPSTVQHFHDIVPNSKFEIIENAGHCTMHDNLPQNLKVINDFLNEIEQK